MEKNYLQTKNYKPKTRYGFTLIETLVAISILLISITGPLTIASKGLISSNIARDQVTAFYLAEEAVEYIRNTRDKNSIVGDNWLTNITKCVSNSGDKKCTIDSSDTGGPISAIQVCGVSCNPLRHDSITGIYGYNGSWNESIFTREIRIKQITTDEVAVSVVISWRPQGFGQPKTFTIRDNLFNW